MRDEDTPLVEPSSQGAEGTDEQSQGNTPPTPGTEVGDSSVTMVIAALDEDGKHVTLSAYVSGIVENDGQCTYSLTPESGTPIEVQNKGIADRATTSCQLVQIDAAKLKPGTWTAQLSYVPVKSGSAALTSDAETIEVP